jgi:hypothetical protein
MSSEPRTRVRRIRHSQSFGAPHYSSRLGLQRRLQLKGLSHRCVASPGPYLLPSFSATACAFPHSATPNPLALSTTPGSLVLDVTTRGRPLPSVVPIAIRARRLLPLCPGAFPCYQSFSGLYVPKPLACIRIDDELVPC